MDPQCDTYSINSTAAARNADNALQAAAASGVAANHIPYELGAMVGLLEHESGPEVAAKLALKGRIGVDPAVGA